MRTLLLPPACGAARPLPACLPACLLVCRAHARNVYRAPPSESLHARLLKAFARLAVHTFPLWCMRAHVLALWPPSGLVAPPPHFPHPPCSPGRLMLVALKRRGEDDRDHYANKRMDLGGPLLAGLFRLLFRKLCKDMRQYVQRWGHVRIIPPPPPPHTHKYTHMCTCLRALGGCGLFVYELFAPRTSAVPCAGSQPRACARAEVSCGVLPTSIMVGRTKQASARTHLPCPMTTGAWTAARTSMCRAQ